LVHKAGQDYAQAWKARDANGLAALYAEDACIKAPGRPDACGRSKIAEASEALWAMFPDARTAWGRAWLKGDALIVESAWTGTNDGDISGRKPTHKIVGASTLTWSWFLPDGKIREQHVYCDEASIAMQLGTGVLGRAFGGLPTTRERHDAEEAASEEANVLAVKDGLATKASAFTDDSELVDFSHPGSLPEKKGASRWIGLRSGPLVSSRVVLSHVVGIGETVISEYEAEGRSQGRSLTVHGVEVLDLEGSKVRRAVRYRDSLESAPLPFLPLPVPSVAL
jgi:ketosteroid isomerase-like protein